MRAIFATILLSTSLATNGCTAVGAAIGATSPRYVAAAWPRETVPLGTEVRVRIRTVGADAVVVTQVDGRYGGLRDGLLSVTDDNGHEHELAVRDVVDVEVRTGTRWKEGLLLGAGADAVIVIAAIAIANGGDVSIATGR